MRAIWLPGSVVSPGFLRLIPIPRAAGCFHFCLPPPPVLPFIEGKPERRRGEWGEGGGAEDKRAKKRREGEKEKERRKGDRRGEGRGREGKGRET